ncbi:murein L,D-transpeptidase [Magnetospirillum sp. UT-4]|uniref:L,D-transpeptidase family protein n=1 Tax=Magnetospirillum sp. UT-4 TaxID=2681467 RepID=UPI00137C7932|nr:L,D-transpeptidase family protein [Magnetospirillum sp. UT-4]CAA7611305.1 putative peptidoglycan-binding domain protein [Magnetospirillum sp. UT-4]
MLPFARPLILCLAVAFAAAAPAAAAEPTELQRLLDGGTGPRLHEAGALRAFYRHRSWKPAWPGAKGEAMIREVQAIAHAEGLADDSYGLPHAASEVERDLLISDTVARFARDLAIGRVAPTRAVGGMGPETRPSADPLRLLRELSGGKALAAAAEALPPPYVGYRRLRAALERYRALVAAGGWPTLPDGPSIKPGMEDERVPLLRRRLVAAGDLAASDDSGTVLDDTLAAGLRRFQARHGIEPDGAVGRQTLAALNASAEERLRQIAVNLERWRWMPRALAPEHIAVNLPAAHLELVRGGTIAMAMRVVVGDVKHQTPSMMTTMSSVVFNPTWTVPPTIATKEILPKLKKEPGYLAANNMTILDAFTPDSPEAQGVGIDWSSHRTFPWRLRQRPGPDNALGQVKFTLSNSDDIYLHDTPKRQYFGRIFRALSHGCVRLERPVDLAQALLAPDWAARVPDLIAETETKTIRLERPLTVYLMYMTAWADEDGTVHFRDDLYGHDGRLRAALKRPRAVAEAGGADGGR